MIQNWIALVTGEEAVPEGFRWAVQSLAYFFYTDDKILASPQTDHLEAVLDILTGLFDRVGLRTNINKMVVMVCQPCRMAGVHLGAVYKI